MIRPRALAASRARARRAWTSAGAALFACLAPGCLAPPAILAPIRRLASDPIAAFPAGTRRVEIPLQEGGVLRGLCVPSDPGSPVVLHFLEAAASCADSPGRETLARELADLGYASLFVDYEGVGLSPGERDSDHLPRDARAAWNEAVELAGAPRRVVLRGTSIGTIAAGILLSEGVTPMAVVLVAPVRADTVVQRGAAALYGWPASWLAALAFRRVAPLDLTAQLAQVRAPLFVAGSRADEFVGAEHVERFERSVRAAGGTWAEFQQANHIVLAALGARVLPGERALLRAQHTPPLETRRRELLSALTDERAACLPEGSQARARFEGLARYSRPGRPALDVAAALGTRHVWDAARLRWLHLDSPYASHDDPLRALLDLEDLAGPLPIDALEELGCWWNPLRVAMGSPDAIDFDALLGGACGAPFVLPVRSTRTDLTLEASLTIDLAKLEPHVATPQMPPATVRRRAFRLLCKLLGIPERPSATDPSAFEVFRRGRWFGRRYPAGMLAPTAD